MTKVVVGGCTVLRGDCVDVLRGMAEQHDMPRLSDKGSPARFFPALGFTQDELRFHYSAKAGKKDRMGTTHLTTKPISLISWLCKLVCPSGGTMLDPTAGSGTLAISASRLGFKAILIEREQEYYDMILKRLDALRAEEAAETPRHPDLFTETAA